MLVRFQHFPFWENWRNGIRSSLAREFGVSDNAIKKLLVRRGFPKHIKEVLAKIT